MRIEHAALYVYDLERTSEYGYPQAASEKGFDGVYRCRTGNDHL